MSKRNDIQWLRALAILSVLGFHICPDTFPYGYLGVDIFFVISGYLMTSILDKPNITILEFYSRRIKRIFPTSLFVIVSFTILGFFVLLPSHFLYLKTETLWSAFFINNFSSMFSEKQYFEMISGFKFFLHTWSLGVEVQFYFIAPFLFYFILSQSSPIFWIGSFAIASLLLQLLVPYESVAFGLMFCRVWQFLIGSASYCLSENEIKGYVRLSQVEEKIEQKTSDNSKSATFLLVLALILICFFPFSFKNFYFIPVIYRILATSLTGGFIYFNENQKLSLSEKLNILLTYIGDASYTIYLIHWPLIIFFKYFSFQEIHGNCFTIFYIFAVSLAVHELFEKPMGKQSMKFNFSVIGIFYFFILVICFLSNSHHESFINYSSSDAIKMNEAEASACASFYYPECKPDPLIDKLVTIRSPRHRLDKYCSYQLTSITPKTLMIIGNSFVYFQIRGIMDAIKQAKTKFSKVYVLCVPGCNLIVGELNKNALQYFCKRYNGSYDALLEAVKPDIIIHNARLDHIEDLKRFPSTNMTDDHAYSVILKTILHVGNLTNKLIIIEPTPNFAGTLYRSPLTVAQMLLTNQTLTKYNITMDAYHKMMDPGWNRVKEAAKHYSKCILIPTKKYFCDKQICSMIDPKTKLGRYCDEAHITPRESLKFIPDLIKAIDSNVF